MKDAEDEAFEAIERKQGGFQAKRKMAADKLQEPVNLLEARRIAAEYGTPDSQVDSGNLYFALRKCLEHIDAQPAQEPTGMLHIDRLGQWLDASLKERKAQPVQEPVAYVTGMSFGRFIVEPINPAMVLPIGMALYSAPQEET
jgi:hypothetical protein